MSDESTKKQWEEVRDQLARQTAEATGIASSSNQDLASAQNSGSGDTDQLRLNAGVADNQERSLQSQTEIAGRQVNIASSATPGTQANPAPANVTPGNNTNVPQFTRDSTALSINPQAINQPDEPLVQVVPVRSSVVTDIQSIPGENPELDFRDIRVTNTRIDQEIFPTVPSVNITRDQQSTGITATTPALPNPTSIASTSGELLPTVAQPPATRDQQSSEITAFSEEPPIVRDIPSTGILSDSAIQAIPRPQLSTDVASSSQTFPDGRNITAIDQEIFPGASVQTAPRPQADTEVPGPLSILFGPPRETPAPIEARTSPEDTTPPVPISSVPTTDDPLSTIISNALARDAARANTAASTTRSARTVAGTNQARRSQIATGNQKDIDWRFRISLRPGTRYLYNDPAIDKKSDALLFPLRATNGVLFPFTPKIDITYQANYESVDPIHSNYKFYNYKNSSVEQISISGDFTAQDTYEANYLLAVIHFFKCVTKMFYGKDQSPQAGVPPPLCYLSGHGTYAFNYHPCVITSFSLNYPTDVDYVNAKIPLGNLGGSPIFNKPTIGPPTRWQRYQRLLNSGIQSGGYRADPINNNPITNNSELTRVPAKMTISLSALPVVTRNDLSNNFSLRDYATGKLLLSNRGSTNSRPTFGGMW